MAAHVAFAPPTPGSGPTLPCSVVCDEHGVHQSFGEAYEVAKAACAEHNRLHHSSTRSTTAVTSLIYTSVAARGFTAARVEEMLTKARTRNRAFGVTGMLLRERGHFLQALEGPAPVVDELMRTIERDRRHDHVRVLVRESRDQRRFPDWAMASGHVRQVEARPLAEYFEALLMARGDAEQAPARHQGPRTEA